MPNLFDTLMNRMQPTPPSPAVGTWSNYQPPPLNRPPGWTTPQPNQQTQVVGPQQGAATPPAPIPPPPNPPAGIPPQGQRFANAEMMKQGYQNGWNPNPVLLKALLNRG